MCDQIVVIGSNSIDLIIEAPRFPQPGETLEGSNFNMQPGGKGGNQAVAAARLGAKVTMIGAVGKDAFGEQLKDNLSKNNVNIDYIQEIDGVGTGKAMITLAESDNQIIIDPAANQYVQLERVLTLLEDVSEIGLVVLQQEIPHRTVEGVIDYCHDHDIAVLLNPAPERSIPADSIAKVTYLTPNETECRLLFPEQTLDEALAQHPNQLIVTLGSKGAVYHNGSNVITIPPVQPKSVVDTTGAGDTFNAGLAVGIVSGLSIDEAVRLGNLAASMAVEALGAQSGAPSIQEIQKHTAYEKTWQLK